jgi:uncharacterized protein YqhQ
MNMPAPKPSCNVGGQAVIEGVMMRSPRSFAVVCRRPGGEIVMREERWNSIWERLKFLRWPFFRGGVVLLEALVNGMSALSFSAQQQEDAEKAASTEAANEDCPVDNGAEAGGQQAGHAKAPNNTASFTGVIVLSIALALGLFVALPHLLTWLIGFGTDTFAFHLVDGAIKVAILVAYIGGIGLMKDIRRVYMYHGAEHKSIYAHEKGLPLTVENTRVQSRFHPRCGTSFLVMVILTSVFLFAILLRQPISSSGIIDHLVKILIKIPLMFPVAGLSYEGIKLSGKFQSHPVVRVLVTPGLWLQRLTTREPTDDQLEVAILALRKTLWREQAAEEVQDSGVEVYRSYSEALPAVEG